MLDPEKSSTTRLQIDDPDSNRQDRSWKNYMILVAMGFCIYKEGYIQALEKDKLYVDNMIICIPANLLHILQYFSVIGVGEGKAETL